MRLIRVVESITIIAIFIIFVLNIFLDRALNFCSNILRRRPPSLKHTPDIVIKLFEHCALFYPKQTDPDKSNEAITRRIRPHNTATPTTPIHHCLHPGHYYNTQDFATQIHKRRRPSLQPQNWRDIIQIQQKTTDLPKTCDGCRGLAHAADPWTSCYCIQSH